MPRARDGSPLSGARIGRIDMPARELLSLAVHGTELDAFLVIGLAQKARGIGLTDDRPRGLPATGTTRRLRLELEGARITAAAAPAPGLVRIDTERSGVARSIVVETPERGQETGLLLVLDPENRILAATPTRALADRELSLGATWTPPVRNVIARALPDTISAFREAGRALVDAHARMVLDRRRAVLERVLARALAKVERRILAIEGDRARLADVPDLRKRGRLLLAGLATIPRGASEAILTDWEVDPPEERRVPIDPALGPKRQATALFDRARRLEAGARIVGKRLAEANSERIALHALCARLPATTTIEALSELASAAAALRVAGAREALADAAPKRGKRPPVERKPFRRFVGHAGREILVGRGAADNDALTLHHARPGDLWLHARSTTGAHVVVPLTRGQACPPELLIDAATLAAHFSDARGEPLVDVTHTARRYVRKPRGAAPGAVSVDREKVLVLRLEPDRLSRLLSSEVRED